MPKGRKFVPSIGDMIQVHDAVAICTDLLTSSLSEKQVYELLYLKDQSIQYASLTQLNGVKRATPEIMRAYMLRSTTETSNKPIRAKKTKVKVVTRRRRAKKAALTESAT